MKQESQEPDQSQEFLENDGASQSLWPDKIVLVIIGLSLLWIALLTYFVASMPPS